MCAGSMTLQHVGVCRTVAEQSQFNDVSPFFNSALCNARLASLFPAVGYHGTLLSR